MDTVITQAIDTVSSHIAGTSVARPVTTPELSLDSLLTLLHQIHPKYVEPSLAERWLWPALVAVGVSVLAWSIQYLFLRSHRLSLERRQFARVWGLALFELREAIERSFYFLAQFNQRKVSHGLLFFSETVASDYFKSYTSLAVAQHMHWLYALLNQVQENLHTSRLIDEVTRNLNEKQPMIYAGAAADFVRSHQSALAGKFNFCLLEWRDYLKQNRIRIDIEMPLLNKPVSKAIVEE